MEHGRVRTGQHRGLWGLHVRQETRMHAHKLRWAKLKHKDKRGGSDSGYKTGCREQRTEEIKINELK